jgi:hypothetical protein
VGKEKKKEKKKEKMFVFGGLSCCLASLVYGVWCQKWLPENLVCLDSS